MSQSHKTVSYTHDLICEGVFAPLTGFGREFLEAGERLHSHSQSAISDALDKAESLPFLADLLGPFVFYALGAAQFLLIALALLTGAWQCIAALDAALITATLWLRWAALQRRLRAMSVAGGEVDEKLSNAFHIAFYIAPIGQWWRPSRLFVQVLAEKRRDVELHTQPLNASPAAPICARRSAVESLTPAKSVWVAEKLVLAEEKAAAVFASPSHFPAFPSDFCTVIDMQQSDVFSRGPSRETAMTVPRRAIRARRAQPKPALRERVELRAGKNESLQNEEKENIVN